jgi:hypothetical protein
MNSRAVVRWLLACIAMIGCGVVAHGQAIVSSVGVGKDFKFPDYYPSSNGVRQLKTLVTGSEAQFVSNNMNVVRLQNPRLTNYTPEGQLEWSAHSPECTVNVNTREVRGSTNMVFRTADEKLLLRGVGFLWQQTNSVLILSNQVFTWIDKRALTNNASTNQ